MWKPLAFGLRNRFRLTLPIVCVLIVVAAVYLVTSENKKTPKALIATVPRTDAAPLAKRFPFLGNFERCSWIAGVAHDGSEGLVPGPSEYFIRAYVVLISRRQRSSRINTSGPSRTLK